MQEGVERLAEAAANRGGRVQRPWLCFVLVTLALVLVFAGSGPLLTLVQQRPASRLAVPVNPVTLPASARVHKALKKMHLEEDMELQQMLTLRPRVPPLCGNGHCEHPETADSCPADCPRPQPQARPTATAATVELTAAVPACGDGKCEPPETIDSCFSDCPGVTTAPMCGEEPHMDPQGHAVADGRSHKKESAAECCEACAAHAANPRNKKRPCNSWVFCYMPICWSLDTGNRHTFGECWLKWQTDATHPLYGQRGRYSDDFRSKHRHAHKHNNLSVPSHVPWSGGILGGRHDASVSWETKLDGSMVSSAGETLVDYRPWESREQNLKRGVKPNQMNF